MTNMIIAVIIGILIVQLLFDHPRLIADQTQSPD